MGSEVTLSAKEAYAAMFAFLEEVYQRTHSDELGALLGDMSLLVDGGTVDPAVWADWDAAVKKVMAGKADLVLSLR